MAGIDIKKRIEALGVVPDPVSGRFSLPLPFRHPSEPASIPVTKFRILNGQLFDGFNHPWSSDEFKNALRGAGLLPAIREPDGQHCSQCGRKLRGMQQRLPSYGKLSGRNLEYGIPCLSTPVHTLEAWATSPSRRSLHLLPKKRISQFTSGIASSAYSLNWP